MASAANAKKEPNFKKRVLGRRGVDNPFFKRFLQKLKKSQFLEIDKNLVLAVFWKCFGGRYLQKIHRGIDRD